MLDRKIHSETLGRYMILVSGVSKSLICSLSTTDSISFMISTHQESQNTNDQDKSLSREFAETGNIHSL